MHTFTVGPYLLLNNESLFLTILLCRHIVRVDSKVGDYSKEVEESFQIRAATAFMAAQYNAAAARCEEIRAVFEKHRECDMQTDPSTLIQTLDLLILTLTLYILETKVIHSSLS